MKILLYNGISSGGAYQALIKYADLLNDFGHIIQIIVPTNRVGNIIQKYCIKFIYRLFYSLFSKSPRKLHTTQILSTGIGKFINSQNADFVIYFWIGDTLSLREIQDTKKPWLWRQSDQNLMFACSHYENELYNFKHQLIDDFIINSKKQFVIKHAEKLFAPSLKVIEGIERVYSVRIKCIITPPDNVLLNESQLVEYSISSDIIKSKYKNGKNINFGFVCNSHEDANRKNIKAAIKIAETMSSHFDVKIIHFGDGKLSNLSPFISDMGNIQDKKILYNSYIALDGMLILSNDDNLPQVLIESLFLGIPIIANDVKGISEFLIPGYNSYVISEPFDIDISGFMRFLLDYRINYKFDAIRSARNLFDKNIIYQKLNSSITKARFAHK